MSDSAPQPSQSHAVLIWLIRGTCVITAIFLAIFLLMIMVALPLGAIGKTIADVSNPWAYRITMAFSALTMVLLYGLIIKKVYCDNFRKNIWNVNGDTVANFSIIFALLLAVDWYHLLPPHLPKVINDHLWIIFRDSSDKVGPSYRYWWSFLAFFIFHKLIKACLLQNLGLNPRNPPQNSIQSVPSVPPDPSDPFVPFDPYDLSKNSPTRPSQQQM
jgi:fumarate reductase subunit D